MTASNTPSICIGVLCHNEERRIGACLASLLPQAEVAAVHVIVNGSTDRTAELARAVATPNVLVHEFAQGGKARSWNRFVFDTLAEHSDIHIFVDGDAEVAPGSIGALVAALIQDDHANLASALPLNGRRAKVYRTEMVNQHGVFGDLYAIRGRFLARMREKAIRLPEDLIGDDGLIAALAKTDLDNEDHWDDSRVTVCADAGFVCEPVTMFRFQTLRMQYRRMINYSVRHFQNRIISRIMRAEGPAGLPRSFASAYRHHSDLLVPRKALVVRHFDRMALSRIHSAVLAE